MFKGLGLKNEDLSKYDTPFVGFDGQMVVPEGQISLPVNMEGKKVMVTFIVVNSFSRIQPFSIGHGFMQWEQSRPRCMSKSSSTPNTTLQR